MAAVSGGSRLHLAPIRGHRCHAVVLEGRIGVFGDGSGEAELSRTIFGHTSWEIARAVRHRGVYLMTGHWGKNSCELKKYQLVTMTEELALHADQTVRDLESSRNNPHAFRRTLGCRTGLDGVEI